MRIINEIKKNLLTLVFLTFLCVSMVNYCGGIVFRPEESQPLEKTEYTEEFIDLQKKQPITVNETVKKSNSIIDSYLGLYHKGTNIISGYDNFLLKDSFLTFNAWVCKNVGMSYIPGTTFLKLENDVLVKLNQNGIFKEEHLDAQFEYLTHFTKKLEDRGIDFLYVDCPNKDRLLNDKLPIGFQNAAKTDERNHMIKLFSEKGLPFLNLTEKMIDNDEELFEMFYKTDHHWKAEYGIDAAKVISEYLNAKLDYQIDTRIFDKSNYSVKKYENCLLGSTGFNSTEAFTETEDFDVFFPKERSEISFTIPSKKIDLVGDFNVFLDYENLNHKEKWPFNAYASYIYGNSAYTKIENRSIDDDHKILIIKDSFANAVVPYLSQVVKRVDVVDLRKNQDDHFNSSIISLIDEHEYDAVLFMYNVFIYETGRLYLK